MLNTIKENEPAWKNYKQNTKKYKKSLGSNKENHYKSNETTQKWNTKRNNQIKDTRSSDKHSNKKDIQNNRAKHSKNDTKPKQEAKGVDTKGEKKVFYKIKHKVKPKTPMVLHTKFRLNNCISLTVIKGENKYSLKALADTGNSLGASAMSTRLYRILKKRNIIDNYVKLKLTNDHCLSANKETLAVRGILQHKLKFNAPNNYSFTLDKFYVIDDLSIPLNLSKAVLAQLGCKWCLEKDYLTLGSTQVKIPLVTPDIEGKMINSSHLQQLIRAREQTDLLPEPDYQELHQRHATRIYTKQKEIIKAKSVKIIQVWPKQEFQSKLRKDRDTVVLPSIMFQTKNGLKANNCSITRRKLMVIALWNPSNSNVKIKKVSMQA